MHMALRNDDWLKFHTAYCHRMHAWISPNACDFNRSNSAAGDLRCAGCNGLYDQLQPDRLQASLCNALAAVLDETSAGTEVPASEPVAASTSLYLDEDELDAAVLQLFPELEALMEEEEPEPEPHQEPAEDRHPALRRSSKGNAHKSQKRYAVYKGRCPRCSGYMLNDIERYYGDKDDEIYRCFTCGWRTSPEYEWNRRHA